MSHKFSDPQEQQDRGLKGLVLLTATGLAFLILLVRLGWLQVMKYDENLRLSESNRIRRIVIKAERGYIYDRNGIPLVRNRPSYQIALMPYQLKTPDSVFNRLLRIRDTSGARVIDSASLAWTFQRARWQKFRPLRIIEDASDAQVAFIEERLEDFPGIITLVESRRDYPFGTMASHVFGYTGEISEKQVEESYYVDAGYSFGDRIGQKGVEKQYELDFRGKNGVKYVEVNAYGKEIGIIPEMEHEPASPGNHLVTTLDMDLQAVAEAAFPDSIKGGLVVLNPQNGEILAMVSSPRLDPNIFSLEKRELAKEWASVALDSTQPLNNRAIMGTYPPGSVFKFITAASALEYGFITEDSKYPAPCTGGFRFGSRYQKCWSPKGHGKMNVVDALRESCDVFFYQCGLDQNMEPINEVGRRFGLGMALGVDIPGEKAGLLMDSVTYNKRFKRLNWKWSRGQILNLAIGQGELVTPLQIAAYFGAMATNTGLYRPHVMKEIRDQEGKLIRRYEPTVISKKGLKSENWHILLNAMEEVISAPHGTGAAARVPGIRVGGKTGSAENPQGDKTHGWFVGVAPLEHPTICVALVMENAGHGGSVAGPVAGKVLRHYFKTDSLEMAKAKQLQDTLTQPAGD
jgi:penicillin-binding protein 2